MYQQNHKMSEGIHKTRLVKDHFLEHSKLFYSRLAIDRSICVLTRPVVITGFNRSLLVDWWSIEKNMVDVKILSISYPN